MTNQEIALSKPMRTVLIVHASITGCDVKHKTNTAVTRCENKHAIDY